MSSGSTLFDLLITNKTSITQNYMMSYILGAQLSPLLHRSVSGDVESEASVGKTEANARGLLPGHAVDVNCMVITPEILVIEQSAKAPSA